MSSLRSLTFVLLLSTIMLVGCRQTKSPFRASGRALEVVTVLPDAYATQALKDSLRKVFEGPIGVLPQDEPWCTLLFTTKSKFTNVFRIHRNILFVDIDSAMYTRNGLHISRDEFANGQFIITAKSPNLESFKGMIRSQAPRVGKMIYREELMRKFDELQGTYSSAMQKLVEDSIGGVTINPIVEIKFTKASKEFVWGSDMNTSGRQDIVVYSYPYTSTSTFTPNYLIRKRDSVMSRHILGEYLNSYMTTEKRITPMSSVYTIHGAYCYELRGLWHMEGDMMGGPFVMHAMVDNAHGRVIVAEAFVYAPSKEKRNLLMNAEACLFTLRPMDTELVRDSVFGDILPFGN